VTPISKVTGCAVRHTPSVGVPLTSSKSDTVVYGGSAVPPSLRFAVIWVMSLAEAAVTSIRVVQPGVVAVAVPMVKVAAEALCGPAAARIAARQARTARALRMEPSLINFGSTHSETPITYVWFTGEQPMNGTV
jgi:hypothetical protein